MSGNAGPRGSNSPRLEGEARLATAERAAALYRRGQSIRQIATALHLSFSVARSVLHEAGVDMRTRGGTRTRKDT